MKKCIFFPFSTKKVSGNPYCDNYRNALLKYVEIINQNSKFKGNIRYQLLKSSFAADIYIFNWLESINSGIKGFFLFLFSHLSLIIIWLRKKEIIWMFHNIHPHSGENLYSRIIQGFLFKKSTCIITHSKEAMDYAKRKASCPVYYFCHPVNQKVYTITKKCDCDVFIWGTILSYKGIPEFLELMKDQDYTIRIIGQCNSSELEKRIVEMCNKNVIYENRRADFDEIASWCQASRFVVFPYIGNSISSSGALIDTITMGGVPVGPDCGAFHDLEIEKVCITYNDESELLEILQGNNTVSQNARSAFQEKYSWAAFAQFVSHLL